MIEKTFKFHILWFFLAFCIGIFYVYLDIPDKKKIIKYPTPYNANKITYMGLSGDCYKFKAKEVKCTNDAKKQTII